VYADESGDHGMVSIDKNYPVFALVFFIMHREDYLNQLNPDFQRLKFSYWGHDQVVLHEREIRKKLGPFSILSDPQVEAEFMRDLTDVIDRTQMELCVSAINKEKLLKKYPTPWNPYEISLHFCMERLLTCLRGHGQEGKRVFVVFESRGKNEDNDLELAFRRIAANQNSWGWRSTDFSEFDFEPVFAKKDANAAGLQMADLIARPCGLHVLRPSGTNRAWDTVRSKIGSRWKNFP